MALKTTLTQPTASGTGTVIATPGMPGAANPVRIVGRNASGAPTTGTFQVGDVVVNTDGTEYVCSAAGTPGTWVQVGASSLSYGTPVNIDASLTSLSAGSLTTVARADHVHTVSNVAGVLLSTVTLGSAGASIVFNSIPQNYKHLRVIINAASSDTAYYYKYLSLRMNNDSSAAYPNSEQGIATTPYTHAYLCTISTSIATVLTGKLTPVDVTIYNYSSSTQPKMFASRGVQFAPTSSTNYYVSDFYRAGLWIAVTPVTSLQFFEWNATNLVSGSNASLYGIL